MDQVTVTKNKYRSEQWAELIRQCQSSGMKVDDWCATNGITHHAYYYWLRKIRKSVCNDLPAALEMDSPVVFKKMEVQTLLPNTQAAVIIRLNGATVEVSEGTSQQTIQAVLFALQGTC